MRVAIWGSYKHGNFGDDLMAVLFAARVSAAGSSPVVLELDRALAGRLGIDSAPSCEELLGDADLCLMGGGAMLEAGNLRWAARGYSRDLELDLVRLWRRARGRVPVHALSIGGSGPSSVRRLSPAKAVLFGSGVVESATVRLPGDVAPLTRLGVPAVCHPDVLLGAHRCFEAADERPAGRLRIGVNLNKRTGAPLAAAIVDWVRAHPDTEAVFIQSHLPGHGADYEILPPLEQRIGHHRYRDPHETTRCLSGFDVLVSSKLHLGVTALSYDVPFVSFAGKAKTGAFLRTVGADGLRYRSGDELGVVGALERARCDVAGEGGPARSLLPGSELAEHIAGSEAHLRRLDELVGRRPSATDTDDSSATDQSFDD